MGGPAIGIDLGTTYSCVAVWHHNQVEIIANNQGNRITPSYVAFTQEECIIGDEAFKQASFNPLNTVFDAKRLIGRQYSDENVERNMKLWPFKVVLGEGEKAMIAVNYRGQEKLFAPEQISAMILAKMKKVAEIFLGEAVSNAVVTVPAYFNDSQRLDTKNAGLIAGLKVMKIINEPTAAAIAYGFNKKVQNCPLHKVILIFDLGGGTFDVSILAIDEGNFQVKATAGDANLGGEDFDNNMVKHFINEFQLKYQKDMMGNPRSLRRLRTACESAKMTLSSIYYTNIDIELLCDGVDFHASITRAKFEELNLNLFKKCMENLEKCLSDAKMVKVDIDEVVLIGGSTQIPKIQQLLKEFFDGKELRQGINPDEAVAKGVAIQAAILSGESYIGELKELQLHDVTPLSVGIGVNHSGEEMKVIIPRNSSIPTHKESIFTTFYDNRSSLLLEVFEGERPLTRDNNLLGKFWLKGIPPTPRGVPKVLVCFDIDENGILNVTTQEMETGRKEHICITNEKESLTRCEMEAMVVKAQIFKACDEEVRRKLEAKHTFENLVYKMRNRLRDVKILSTLRDEDELRIEETIAEAIEWVGSSDQVRKVEELEEKLKEVEIICKPIVERGERGQDHMQIHR